MSKNTLILTAITGAIFIGGSYIRQSVNNDSQLVRSANYIATSFIESPTAKQWEWIQQPNYLIIKCVDPMTNREGDLRARTLAQYKKDIDKMMCRVARVVLNPTDKYSAREPTVPTAIFPKHEL